LNEEEEKEEERRKKKRNEQQMAAIPPPSFAPPPPDPTPKEDQTEEGRIRLALEELSKIKAPRANPYAKKNFKTSAVASNIMTKYGWQEGQGLGKESQGISTALAVEKTSIKGGKIVNVAAERELMIEEDKKKVKTLTNIMKNPTKVILLENMVGPGEVDDDLQPEVIEECSKYGEIINCLIYEIPEGASDDEAVRIFVEFTKMDSAIKAVIDLNNRYFGGRTVRASFYSEDKFSKFDLAPETGTE
jgi:splicing factor 45